MTLIVAMAIPLPSAPPSNVIVFPGGPGPSPLPPSNVIAFPGGAGAPPNLVALPGGVGGTAPGSASGALWAWLARAGAAGALATIIVLITATPTGNLTITRHSSGTMSGPSPVSSVSSLSSPSFSPPSVHLVSLGGDSDFYHAWGGQRGADQAFYLSRFPRGDTVVTQFDPDSPRAYIRGNFRAWFGVLNENLNVEVIPPPSARTPDQEMLRRGFMAHAHAQLGHYITPTIPPELIAVYSQLVHLPAPFYRPIYWKGLPRIVWKYDSRGGDPSRDVSQIGFYGGDYIIDLARKDFSGDISLAKRHLIRNHSNGPTDEVYVIEYNHEVVPVLKLKRRSRRDMACCSEASCAVIKRELRGIRRDIDEYLKHSFSGHFPPICAEAGTLNPLGQPYDWTNPATVAIAMGSPDRFDEVYNDKGLAGIAAIIKSLAFQLGDTALATAKAKARWCEVEPETETVVLATGIAEDSFVDLPDTTIYVIVEITVTEPELVKNIQPSTSRGIPSSIWGGYVTFYDSDGVSDLDLRLTSMKTRLGLPFVSPRILVKPASGVQFEVRVKRVVP